MTHQRLRSGPGAFAGLAICGVIVATALSFVALVGAADQPIDLDQNAANGAESKVSTKVLQTYPVRIENTILNNAAGSSFIFKWDGAGPGGFHSSVTAGPGVGTIWVWSTAYQVYSILSPVNFTPTRTLPVFGSSNGGVQTGATTSFMAPGKSIYPSSVTLSDAALSSSLITFFSPEKTVAACGFECAPGECEIFLENRTDGTATIATQQLGCCPEPHQLICEGECKSYLTDVTNCGGCGNVCAADEICSDGACVCPAGQLQCGDGCIDPQTDPTNCGACGNACGPEELCGEGACVCLPGLTQCGDGCVDTLTDTANCGACGNACGPEELCGGGACACLPGLTQCGEGCIDTLADAANCGACGNVCAEGASCSNGACVCPAGQTACGGVCVALQSDPLNCGACGNVCGANQICSAGACSTCRPPRGTACGNQCVNLHTDPLNCGGCGSVCDFSGCPSAGQGTCSQGSSCVCSPAATNDPTSASITFKPTARPTSDRLLKEASPRSQAAGRSRPAAGVTVSSAVAPPPADAGPGPAGVEAVSTTATPVRGRVSSLDVQEAPVCDLAPIEQTLPAGGMHTQSLSGGRFGREILTSVSVTVDGQTIARGPCPQIVPVTDVDTSGVILSPIAVAARDASGDALCQPGEAWCEYLITAADLGDSPCTDPVATLTSPPDQFNPNPITFLNATSAYPSFPAYPGDGVPLDKKTNSVAFSIALPSDQASDVGRPFVMNVTCSNRPEMVQMPITLGIGAACDPNKIDGETYDRLDGFQSPVRAALVAQGTPVNYSDGNFNLGSTIPLKVALSCGSRALADAEVEPNPEIVSLEHETLGPQSLQGINGDNNANPDDPGFSCSSTGCDYQFRTDSLPVGRYIIGVRMPDSRIFQAGLTIKP